MKRHLFPIFTIALLLPVIAISGDTIELKNGKKITGSVINQTRTDMQIKTGGIVKKIPKNQILRVIYRTPEEERKIEAQRKELERKRAEEEQKRLEQERKEKERQEKLEKKRAEEERKRLEQEQKEKERQEKLEKKRAEEEQKRLEREQAQKEREEQRERERIAKEETRKQAEADQTKEEEQKRLKKEERKRQKASRKAEIRALARRHYLTPTIGYGSARYHSYIEDVATGDYNTFNLFGRRTGFTESWKQRTSVSFARLEYGYNRFFARLKLSRNPLKPSYLQMDQTIDTKSTPAVEIQIYRKFNDTLARNAGSFEPGFIFFLRRHFESALFVGYTQSDIGSKTGHIGQIRTRKFGTQQFIDATHLGNGESIYHVKGKSGGLLFRFKYDPFELAVSAATLKENGTQHVSYYELFSFSGQDLFLSYFNFPSNIKTSGNDVELTGKYRVWKNVTLVLSAGKEYRKISSKDADILFFEYKHAYDGTTGQWITDLHGIRAEDYVNVKLFGQNQIINNQKGADYTTEVRFGIENRFDF